MDLEGQLSNPATPLKTLAAQGPKTVQGTGQGREHRSNRGRTDTDTAARQQSGHYSNPALGPPATDSSTAVESATPPAPPRQVTLRLQAEEVDELVAAYLAGDTVNDLAQQFAVHRTTVMAHLARREAKRPETSTAMWDDDTLVAAARLYTSGASLAQVGARFGVHASTVANRFQRAGVQIRPRRGWSKWRRS